MRTLKSPKFLGVSDFRLNFGKGKVCKRKEAENVKLLVISPKERLIEPYAVDPEGTLYYSVPNGSIVATEEHGEIRMAKANWNKFPYLHVLFLSEVPSEFKSKIQVELSIS